ncbi:MAG: methylenetetrahydrofolate--tRNA-(uracil(54)-C(5))-methyltransferase (FADH(2)-oxidizing) TrmFO [Pseudobdellovibrionaceae bacterium]
MGQNSQTISIVGGGLAGSECALQLASFGYKVLLFEMRDKVMTPAHKTQKLAELVCSNSFGSMNPISAPGQIKWEAERLHSHVLKAAYQAQIPAGQALGMDREFFSQIITEMIENHPNIEIRRDVVTSLKDIPRPTVIATGPLTHPSLAADLQSHFGDSFLYFFDAIAPIIDTDSIDMSIAWKADRYGKGTKDYINCPMNKEEYNNFIKEVAAARKVEPKDFEKDTPFFEGCMPIEVMVDRGPQTLRFGPMKPVGLDDPRTGRYPFAVVQLRQDNREGTAYNMVGFQTRMAYPEQKRVFKMIPGLQNAEFLKLGSIHRNLYINSPRCLSKDLSSQKDPNLYFAGQITGVEGYFESTCTGLMVSHFIHQKLSGLQASSPPRESAFGSLLEAITDPERADHFQPTNMNFSLFPLLENSPKDKTIKKNLQVDRAKTALNRWALSEQKEEQAPLPRVLPVIEQRTVSAES